MNETLHQPPGQATELRPPHVHFATETSFVTAGTALGELIAANSPALHTLELYGTALDAGLVPLCAALRSNTHLKRLTCKRPSMALMRDSVRPAMQANPGLQVTWF